MCRQCNNFLSACLTAVIALQFLLFCTACTDRKRVENIDSLNDKAYYYHYISLDSASLYADFAFQESGSYGAGRMEAVNNKAFVDMALMDYKSAETGLQQVLKGTDNQIELFVANVQMMRLCQRMSRNKEFYTYYQAAMHNEERIRESLGELAERQRRRYAYAVSEMKIVCSAYLYYIGQIDGFRNILRSIDADGDLKQDTAQMLNCLYNTGEGGFYSGESNASRSRKEFSDLIKCYLIALRGGHIYWQANALQSMSEHLLDKETAPFLTAENRRYLRAINEDDVPDSLLALSFAERALALFAAYGDTYQVSAALRTLSDCRFAAGDYPGAISSLELALSRNPRVMQSSALTSSIYERLSINYSAVDNKPVSDQYRNLYLDTQENTRQDRELDVRAEQLNNVSSQLNIILLILLIAVIILFAVLYILLKKRNKIDNHAVIERLLEPLERWKERETRIADETAMTGEYITERTKMESLSLERNMQINVGQRAKVTLLCSIMPFINRIIAETDCLKNRAESGEKRRERFAYISELTAKINEYNDVLTRWIQLRKGEVSLKIESFALQELFDILAKGKATFEMRGVRLAVKPCSAVVKADRALTLFMLNTIADNARKATEEGGEVTVSAEEGGDYVEISVKDTGKGMDEEQLQGLFSRTSTDRKQHGFGLINCKGIIEKYKKTSRIFSVCAISAESVKGKGSVLRFRLPRGVLRIMMLLACMHGVSALHAADFNALNAGKTYADSTYFCNLQGRYSDALDFAKEALNRLNKYYKSVYPEGKDTVLFAGTGGIAELHWLSDTLDIDYGVILDIRNEAAVAALALHEWDVYRYNNRIYTRLFKELSTDKTLSDYVERMSKAGEAKNVAIVLLALLLIIICAAYYFLYYRYKVNYRLVVERINRINGVLFDGKDDAEKPEKMRNLWNGRRYMPVIKRERRAFGELDSVVEQIINALEKSRNTKMQSAEDMETAVDELRRIKYESECLHVSNNILDNCLSAVKHETMYYPPTIERITESPDKNIELLDEVARYYRALFSLLTMQAQSQVKSSLKTDDKLKSYLKSLLCGLFKGCYPTMERRDLNGVYEQFTYDYAEVTCSDEELNNLFMPLTVNLKCMLIRQIVREMGDNAGKRACGVRALRRREGGISIVLTLAKEIKYI